MKGLFGKHWSNVVLAPTIQESFLKLWWQSEPNKKVKEEIKGGNRKNIKILDLN